MKVAGVALLCACWAVAGYIVGFTSQGGLAVPSNPRSVFVTRDPLTVESSIGLGKHEIPAGSEFFIEVLLQGQPGSERVFLNNGNCGFVTPDGKEIWCTTGDEMTGFPAYTMKGGMEPTPEVVAAFKEAADELPLPPDWEETGDTFVTEKDAKDDSRFFLVDGVLLEQREDRWYYAGTEETAMFMKIGRDWVLSYKDRNSSTEVFIPGAGWTKVADLERRADPRNAVSRPPVAPDA